MNKRFSRLVGVCIVLVGGAVSWPLAGPASATSGLKVIEQEQVTEGDPPCDQTRVTTFRVRIRNDNGPLLFCNEDVNPIRVANLVEQGLKDTQGPRIQPPGSFSFLGFSFSQTGARTATLTKLGMNTGDDNATDFFFDVQTGPATVPLLGMCDFEEANFAVTICDGGGNCDFGPWADKPDPICEHPKNVLQFKLRADTTNCPASPTGTARIQGTVTNADGSLAGDAHVEASRGCRGSADFISASDTTKRLPPAQRGQYAITGLPGPATYTVEARDHGKCATVSVTLPASGSTVTQNLVLNNDCN